MSGSGLLRPPTLGLRLASVSLALLVSLPPFALATAAPAPLAVPLASSDYPLGSWKMFQANPEHTGEGQTTLPPLAPGAMGFASEMLAGSVVLLALAAAAGESMSWPLQPRAVWAWGYLVVFGSLVAFNAYMVLLARTSAGVAASYTFVNPIIAMLLGITLGRETIAPLEWAAAGVILTGVVLLLAGQARTRDT